MGNAIIFSLILVEASDVIFAVDSIPAIFAVTSDPFIVLTANLMAILGFTCNVLPVGWCRNQTALPTVMV